MSKEIRIELGDIAKDAVSGFTGVVVADTVWLHGCRRFTLASQKLKEDGSTQENHTFDENQLVLVTKSVVETTGASRDAEGKVPGGPTPNPESKETPSKT